MLQKITYGYRLYKTLQEQGRVPVKANTLLILCIVYVLLPFDFLPDPFIIIGQLDDLAFTGTALFYIFKWLNKKATPLDKAKANAVTVQ